MPEELITLIDTGKHPFDIGAKLDSIVAEPAKNEIGAIARFGALS